MMTPLFGYPRMTVFETDITDLSHDGRGVAHVNGKAVFVAGALVGERVRVHFSGKHRHYDEAAVEEVLRASPDRVVPRCAHFGVCGGCALQHLAPEAQIAAKQRVLLENLERIGKVAPKNILPPLVDSPWSYRRKARLSVKFVDKKGRVLVGFRESNGRYVADIARCEVLMPAVGERIADIAALIETLDVKRDIPQIEVAVGDDLAVLVFRHLQPLSERDRAALIEFGTKWNLGIFLQPGGIDSVAPLWPADAQLTFRLPNYGVELEFKPLDFVQVNAGMNKAMIDHALGLLDPQPTDRVLDLFCGLGNFTLPTGAPRRAGIRRGRRGRSGAPCRRERTAQRRDQRAILCRRPRRRPARCAVGQRRSRSAPARSAAQWCRSGAGIPAEKIRAAHRLRVVSSRFAGARRGHAREPPRIHSDQRRCHGHVPAHGACRIDCSV